MLDLLKRNTATLVNNNYLYGRLADIHITDRGSDWYFTVCALMGASTMAFLGLAATKPKTHRVFHYLTAAITATATIAYFAMGSNLGFDPVPVEYHRSASTVSGNNRAVFYVRYIDWFITTPLLLLDLMLTAGMPWPSIFAVIFADEVMIVTGLAGALVQSNYKWGFFTFGCAALLYIVWELAWTARRHANHLGSDVGRAFLICGSVTTVVWICYPIAWGVSEGGNVIAPDSEAVFYGILDLIAKPVFGALLIWGHRNIEPSRLGLHVRDIAEAATNSEKHHNYHHDGAIDGSNGHPLTSAADPHGHTTTGAHVPPRTTGPVV